MKRHRKHFMQLLAVYLLLGAFSLFVSPGELLHELVHHEDTTDVVCMDYCSDHVSPEHRHCEVLQLSAPPLYYEVSTLSISSPASFLSLPVEGTCSYHFASSPFLFFRGPPAMIS